MNYCFSRCPPLIVCLLRVFRFEFFLDGVISVFDYGYSWRGRICSVNGSGKMKSQGSMTCSSLEYLQIILSAALLCTRVAWMKVEERGNQNGVLGVYLPMAVSPIAYQSRAEMLPESPFLEINLCILPTSVHIFYIEGLSMSERFPSLLVSSREYYLWQLCHDRF